MNPTDARAALIDVLALLERESVPAFLWGGTLLGAIRDNRFIPWDGDVDVGVLAEHVPDDLADRLPDVYRRTPVQPYMRRHAPMRIGNVGLRLRDVKVGIHVMARGSSGDRFYTFHRRLVRVPDVTPLALIGFTGLEVLAPADPAAALAWLYGPDWRTPVRAYNGEEPERVNQARYLVGATA